MTVASFAALLQLGIVTFAHIWHYIYFTCYSEDQEDTRHQEGDRRRQEEDQHHHWEEGQLNRDIFNILDCSFLFDNVQ